MTTVQTLTDQELLLLLRNGDDTAFKHLYQRYHQPLYSFLHKFLKSAELTEDITQEIFIKIWNDRATLPQLMSVRSYLFTIGRNHAFNFLKRAGVDQHAKSEILKHYCTDSNSLENTIHARDYQRYLTKLLHELTSQDREVFRLCRQEGKSYDETAELLGISRNTVKKHMVHSMRVLSDAIERDLGISLTILVAILTQVRP
jgi:RNA polymerase sigma-70 factor (family 1)